MAGCQENLKTSSVRLHHFSSCAQSVTINHSIPKDLIKSRAVNQMWPHHQNHSARRRFSLIHLFFHVFWLLNKCFSQFFLVLFFRGWWFHRALFTDCKISKRCEKLHQKKIQYVHLKKCKIKLLECIFTYVTTIQAY